MIGIYLHIPFCKRRCIYCDFFSSTDSSMKRKYVDALCQEMEMRRDEAKGTCVQTVYLGGGTPSQLSADELSRLFAHLYKVYDVAENAEITLEANPDDLTDEYIDLLGSLPVNRVSMGVQSFNDDFLTLLKRRHTSAQVLEAVDKLKQKGIGNISIDLIYGLPGQSLRQWEEDLQQALMLDVPHISAYSLIYEEGTTLWNLRQQGILNEVPEELVAKMYASLAAALTEAGYEHYEISNFCRPGMESRHNSSYWQAVPYIGCGAAAHSFDGHASRWWNVASIPLYIDGILKGSPVVEGEELDLPGRYNDYMVTAMRTSQGASLEEVERRFGVPFRRFCLQAAERHIREGRLLLQQQRLRLSPESIFVSDGIISDLLWVD